MRAIVLVVVLVMSANAAADEAVTTVEGRVVDVLATPVADARVYVFPLKGEAYETVTDQQGRYRVVVRAGGRYRIAVAVAGAYLLRSAQLKDAVANHIDIDVEIDTSGGEVITIEDSWHPPAKQQPTPTQDVRALPPYSDEAVLRDAWARAWLLLDVDARGTVTRLKVLKAPGFGLDKICIEEAFKLTFEPARDGAGKPVGTYLLWTMEWPAWGWLSQGGGVPGRVPVSHQNLGARAENVHYDSPALRNFTGKASGTAFAQPIDSVPCAGSGPLNLDRRNLAYRDCSRPDLARAPALPWITRETILVAVAELKSQRAELDKDYRPSSPLPGYVSGGVTAALAVVTLYSIYQWSEWQDRSQALNWTFANAEEHAAITATRDRWGQRSLFLAAGTIVSGGVTFLLWHRNPRKSSFSVQPSEQGAAAVYAGRW